tara:strand:- start:10849 stop:11571 length:723 start_codon:yes stop_codon:yes gene_type:complete
MEKFSIIVTCVNETKSLIKTIDILLEENDSYIKEIIIIYPDRVTNETLDIVKNLCNKFKKVIQLKQKKPHVGGAVRDGFDIAKGTFTIMMAGDLETDPYDVKEMIKIFNSDANVDLVTASRWKGGGKFNGYGLHRVFYNYIFNKIFAFLYNTNLTDMTFGYRGFKTELVKNIQWENFKHSFFFETIVKPLRLGCNVKEIQTHWEARDDGEPQISRDYFNFVWIGLRNRFKMIKTKGQIYG